MLLAAGCAAGGYIALRAITAKLNAQDDEWSSSSSTHASSVSDHDSPSARHQPAAIEQPTGGSPSRDQSRALRDGALVCLTDQYGGYMVAQQVGKHWELTASTSLPVLTFSEGGVVLCHQPYDSLFVVVKKRDGSIILHSVGADGRVLQAHKDKGAPHRIVTHQAGGAELWRATSNGIINAHYRHKKLGYAIHEVHAVTLDALKGLDAKYAVRMQELRHQADAVQRKLAESARRTQEMELVAANAAADHQRKVDGLNSQLQRALECLNGSEEQKLRQSSAVLQLEQRIGALSSEKQEADEQLGRAHAKIAALQQELLNLQDRHVMEKRKLAHDMEAKLEGARKRKDQQLQEMQQSMDAVRSSLLQLERDTRQKEHARASLAHSLAVKDAEMQHLTTQCQRLEYALKTIQTQISVAAAPPPRLDRASLDAVSLQELRDAVDRMKGGDTATGGRAGESAAMWQLLHAEPNAKEQDQRQEQGWGSSSGAAGGMYADGQASRDGRTPSPLEAISPGPFQLHHVGATQHQAAAAMQHLGLRGKFSGSLTLQDLLKSAGAQMQDCSDFLAASTSQCGTQQQLHAGGMSSKGVAGKDAWVPHAAGVPMRDSAASMASRRGRVPPAVTPHEMASPCDTCNSCTADTPPNNVRGGKQAEHSSRGSTAGRSSQDDAQAQHRYSYSDDSDCGSCGEPGEAGENLMHSGDELEPGLEEFHAAQQQRCHSQQHLGSGNDSMRQQTGQQQQHQQQQCHSATAVRGLSGGTGRLGPALSPVKEEDERASCHTPRPMRKHVAFQLQDKPSNHASYKASPIYFNISDAVASMHTASPTRAAALANCVADAMTAQHMLMPRNGPRAHSPDKHSERLLSLQRRNTGSLQPLPADSPSPNKKSWPGRGVAMGDVALRTAMERDRLNSFLSKRPMQAQQQPMCD